MAGVSIRNCVLLLPKFTLADFISEHAWKTLGGYHVAPAPPLGELNFKKEKRISMA